MQPCVATGSASRSISNPRTGKTRWTAGCYCRKQSAIGCRPRRSGNTPARPARPPNTGSATIRRSWLNTTGGYKTGTTSPSQWAANGRSVWNVRHAGQRGGMVPGFVDDKWYATSPMNDPQGPLAGAGRVARGGGSTGVASCCRVTFRTDDRGPGRRQLPGLAGNAQLVVRRGKPCTAPISGQSRSSKRIRKWIALAVRRPDNNEDFAIASNWFQNRRGLSRFSQSSKQNGTVPFSQLVFKPVLVEVRFDCLQQCGEIEARVVAQRLLMKNVGVPFTPLRTPLEKSLARGV